MRLQSTTTRSLKLGCRLLIVGFWTGIIGLLILIIVPHIQPVFASAGSGLNLAATTTLGEALLLDWLRTLNQSGYVTFGLGSLVMAVGGAVVFSTVT